MTPDRVAGQHALVTVEQIENRIVTVRGQKVMLDTDLAEMYGVPTKRLNEQVKRNPSRFPPDFVFRLNREEVEGVNRSQIATGSQKHRDPRFPPFAFTEHGAIMAANVLEQRPGGRSERLRCSRLRAAAPNSCLSQGLGP